MGYLHAPEKTAAEFCNGYWKSGDFGRIDANGYLYVLDRVKDTIICNDRKVYPSQVEAALSSHPQAVSYTHLRAHETVLDLVCRLLLEKKKKDLSHTH